MTVLRGEIWLAELNPVRGSEQAGIRPVLVMQTNAINRFTTTILAICFLINSFKLPTFLLLINTIPLSREAAPRVT